MSEEIKDQELERDEQTAAEEQTDCQTNEQAQPQEEELTESPAEELSPEAKLQAELDKLKDAHLRLVAEYDNYRKRTLSRQGVTAIPTEGESFDDELHEAIATFPAPEESLKGKIIDCVKKGYKLHDKVLRHSSVVVGQ